MNHHAERIHVLQPVRTGVLLAVLFLFLEAACGAVSAEAKTASDISKEQFVSAVAAVVKTARENNYRYGDSRAAVPTTDHIISCDRMIAKALWDLGFTDQHTGGITVGDMAPYLQEHGFPYSTSFSDIGYGSIVMVNPDSNGTYRHTFVTLEYDPDTGETTKYDCGSKRRIDSDQPFEREPWYYSDQILVFNIPNHVKVKSVRLDTTAAVMVPGQALTLHPTVTPENAADLTVRWVSSDSTVAAVSQTGTMRTKNPGKANIYAISNDSGVKAVCSVEVLPIPVTDVSLNLSSKTVKAGTALKLKAKVAPSEATDPAVKWTSSRPAVASVSAAGVVRTLKAGTARITAKAGGKTAACLITVYAAKKKTAVRSVKISLKKLTLRRGKTRKLKAVIRPQNATNRKVIWKSTNPKIAKVNRNGKVTAKKKGTAYIIVTSADGKKKARCKVVVK